MVASPQILEYSIIMHQIIHSFESDNLGYWICYWSNWFVEMVTSRFIKNMENHGNLGDIETSMQI